MDAGGPDIKAAYTGDVETMRQELAAGAPPDQLEAVAWASRRFMPVAIQLILCGEKTRPNAQDFSSPPELHQISRLRRMFKLPAEARDR